MKNTKNESHQKNQVIVALDQEEHEKLKALANRDGRTLGAQLTIMAMAAALRK